VTACAWLYTVTAGFLNDVVTVRICYFSMKSYAKVEEGACSKIV